MREKPRSARMHMALFVALLITAVVGVVWVLSLPARFSEAPQTSAEKHSPSAELQSFIDRTKNEVVGRTQEAQVATSTREDDAPSSDVSPQEPREVLVGTSTSAR